MSEDSPAARTQKARDVVEGQSSTIELSAYSGPLPHPELLRQFEALHPGTAARVFDNFFSQAQHRRDLEAKVIKADSLSQVLGSIASAVIGIGGLGGGIWLAHEGRSLTGLAAILGVLASLVGTFLYQKAKPASTKRSPDLAHRTSRE